MGVQVSWDTEKEQPPARRAAFASMTAATAGDKEAWLALFAPDGVFVYRVREDGLVTSMRAFWETERAMATARKVTE